VRRRSHRRVWRTGAPPPSPDPGQRLPPALIQARISGTCQGF
jgi:hypothetical protein